MSDTAARIYRLLEPILASFGLTLWDLEFKKEGPRWLLRVYIDREPAGVTLEDCEAVSRDLGTTLEMEDVITHAYTLEVSSPGLDRTLSRPEHYLRSLGRQVRIKTYQPVDGEKVFTGALRSAEGGSVLLLTGSGEELIFSIESIARANWLVVL